MCFLFGWAISVGWCCCHSHSHCCHSHLAVRGESKFKQWCHKAKCHCHPALQIHTVMMNNTLQSVLTCALCWNTELRVYNCLIFWCHWWIVVVCVWMYSRILMSPSTCPQEKRQIKRVHKKRGDSDIKEPGHIQCFLFSESWPDKTHTRAQPLKINPNIADRHQNRWNI